MFPSDETLLSVKAGLCRESHTIQIPMLFHGLQMYAVKHESIGSEPILLSKPFILYAFIPYV